MGLERMRHFVSAVFAGSLRGALAAGAGLFAVAGMAVAQDGQEAVVVELYTSQGCSSCPPADAFMGELAQADRVIALSLHVDYWDYIGWADSFAQAAFTDRQKSYARAAGSRMIYTPQMIVGGVDRVEGNAPDAVVQLIGRHLAVAPNVRLTLRREDGQVVIRAVAARPLPEGAQVDLVRYAPVETVTIERGENAGQVMTYHNVVTLWQKLADWPGAEPLELRADAPGDEPVVVIVQEPGPAAILAAARIE